MTTSWVASDHSRSAICRVEDEQGALLGRGLLRTFASLNETNSLSNLSSSECTVRTASNPVTVP